MFVFLTDPKTGKRIALNTDAVLMFAEGEKGAVAAVTFAGATVEIPLRFDDVEDAIESEYGASLEDTQ